MDAPAWNGDEDRDIPSVEEHCDRCAVVLLPSESFEGRCARCTENLLDDEGPTFDDAFGAVCDRAADAETARGLK